MAYTTDRTWVVGEIVTASLMNTYVRDNIKWLSTDKPMVRAYHNTTQSLNTATFTPIVFNTDLLDNASVHETTGANTSRFTVPSGAAGKWVFGGTIIYAPNASGLRFGFVYVNGGDINASVGSHTVDGIFSTYATTTTLYSMAAADYFQLVGYHTVGVASNVSANSNAWAFWLGV